MISAFSTFSSVILLSSFVKDTEKGRFRYPKRREEPQTAEIPEHAERMKYE
jgi:hypothetical protein